jgi:hypothetical protein
MVTMRSVASKNVPRCCTRKNPRATSNFSFQQKKMHGRVHHRVHPESFRVRYYGGNSGSGPAPYLLGDARAKEPACATRVHSPLLNLGGVRPHEVAERALVRDLLITVQRPDLQGRAINALVHTTRVLGGAATPSEAQNCTCLAHSLRLSNEACDNYLQLNNDTYVHPLQLSNGCLVGSLHLNNETCDNYLKPKHNSCANSLQPNRLATKSVPCAEECCPALKQGQTTIPGPAA